MWTPQPIDPNPPLSFKQLSFDHPLGLEVGTPAAWLALEKRTAQVLEIGTEYLDRKFPTPEFPKHDTEARVGGEEGWAQGGHAFFISKSSHPLERGMTREGPERGPL